MAGDNGLHVSRMLLPRPRRALDVREHERDRPRRRPRHTPSIAQPRAPPPGVDTTRLSRKCIKKVTRGHYDLGVDARCSNLRLAAAFDELVDMI